MPTAQDGSDGEHTAHLGMDVISHTVRLVGNVHGYVCKLLDGVTLGRYMAGLEPKGGFTGAPVGASCIAASNAR